jgi:hypothetical protein
MLKVRGPLILDLPDEAWFDVRLMQKDIVLALDTGRELRLPLPTAATADELLTVARALGYERRDLAALYEVLGRLAGDLLRAERDSRADRHLRCPAAEGRSFRRER